MKTYKNLKLCPWCRNGQIEIAGHLNKPKGQTVLRCTCCGTCYLKRMRKKK